MQVEARKDPVLMQDEIVLSELIRVLWSKKLIIAAISILVGACAAVISLMSPNIYRSEVLLAPAEDSNAGALASLAGQFGGLASIAGVNIGRNGTSKVGVGLEVLKSRAFISSFIKGRDILVPLFAGKQWDPMSGELVYDPQIYNRDTQQWVSADESVTGQAPSDWKAFKAFSSMLNVNQQKDTGLITVSVDYVSPVLAQQWVSWLVKDVNDQLRQRDIEEANRSIEYLKQELDKTSVAGMQQIFYQLIEKQMQTIMLAKVRDQYVFKVVDPPIIPEEKISPKRALIVILSIVVAGSITTFFYLIRYVFAGRSEPHDAL